MDFAVELLDEDDEELSDLDDDELSDVDEDPSDLPEPAELDESEDEPPSDLAESLELEPPRLSLR